MNTTRAIAAGLIAAVTTWGVAASSTVWATPVPPPPDAGTDGPFLSKMDPIPAQPPPEKTSPPPSRGVAPHDKPTIQKLHDANLLEIQMGKLAQEKGTSRAVKDFGRKLVADHTAVEKKLDAYLRARGSKLSELALTSAVDPDHEMLATKSGTDFDLAFCLQAVNDHTKNIDLLQSARIETGDDDLRAIYDELLSTEQAHKRAAQDIIASSARASN